MLLGTFIRILTSLIRDFCTSDRNFASTFFQIPPHDGHPWCSAISFPLLGRIRDFHPLETCAARRTIQKKPKPHGFELRLYIHIFCFGYRISVVKYRIFVRFCQDCFIICRFICRYIVQTKAEYVYLK